MRLMFYVLFPALLLGLGAAPVYARPVSYAGGWMAMQMNDGDGHSLLLNYSPTAKYSVGYKGEYWNEKEWQFHGVGLNNLLYRWNNPDSQGNLYLSSGAGVAYSDFGTYDGKAQAAGFTGIIADWEDRRFFVSYENRLTYAGDIDQSFTERGRLGIAPYVAEYGALHTWFMVQFDHKPGMEDVFTVTPLVRLFKGSALVEVGVSDQKDVLLNVTYGF
ncbi:MAG: hypothetical protein K0R63_1722 [Rickettsiales bacterium]|jgi:hypothetical protein|nr:hypothetical protein [Rickettsiales bacterium]